MKPITALFGAAVALAALTTTGCVTSGTHEAVLADLAKTKKALTMTREQLKSTTAERKEWNEKAEDCDGKLTVALDQNTQLVSKVESMGQNVEALLGEKDKLAHQRDQLTKEREELAKEVAELRRMRAAAEARSAEYKKLLAKLHKMIDAGSLEVKIRNGRMLVTMSSDVLFRAGSAHLKPEAVEAIQELAGTIATFPDRKFQVIGHSDSTPIKTARFPSNWELSSQRAIEVVKVMIDAGVPAEMLSAAGAADTDPVAPNDTPDNMALNRRIEVAFVPKIDELPGFDEVLKK